MGGRRAQTQLLSTVDAASGGGFYTGCRLTSHAHTHSDVPTDARTRWEWESSAEICDDSQMWFDRWNFSHCDGRRRKAVKKLEERRLSAHAQSQALSLTGTWYNSEAIQSIIWFGY